MKMNLTDNELRIVLKSRRPPMQGTVANLEQALLEAAENMHDHLPITIFVKSGGVMFSDAVQPGTVLICAITCALGPRAKPTLMQRLREAWRVLWGRETD